jgi:NAD(P)-dependent dehydrogenase (short-subunit alcohol dehydrogenase family)
VTAGTPPPRSDAPGAVLVTGASTGIGAACAAALARHGYRVFAGVRTEDDGRRLAGIVPGLTPVRLDVTDAGDIARAAQAVGEAVGAAGLAGLVNNAGIAVAGPLEVVPIADLRRQLEVNVIGQVAVTQAMLPLLRRARGRIVLVGSISGRIAVPFLGPYAASKFALEAIADSLRVELAPEGIGVVLVEPGEVRTPIWDKGRTAGDALLARTPPEVVARYGRGIGAVQRLALRAAEAGASPDTVAEVVVAAIAAARPPSRRLVGRDAKARAWLARLPDRLRDRLVRRALRW